MQVQIFYYDIKKISNVKMKTQYSFQNYNHNKVHVLNVIILTANSVLIFTISSYCIEEISV